MEKLSIIFTNNKPPKFGVLKNTKGNTLEYLKKQMQGQRCKENKGESKPSINKAHLFLFLFYWGCIPGGALGYSQLTGVTPSNAWRTMHFQGPSQGILHTKQVITLLSYFSSPSHRVSQDREWVFATPGLLFVLGLVIMPGSARETICCNRDWSRHLKPCTISLALRSISIVVLLKQCIGSHSSLAEITTLESPQCYALKFSKF